MARNTIFYGFLTPPVTGGDFVSLDHVTVLRRLGFDARAYYGAHDDGYLQFPVPVTRPRSFDPNDILVLAENQSLEGARNIPAIKVMHNQNPYIMFYGTETVAQLNAFPLAHILVPSDFCRDKLRELGVEKPISRIHPALPGYFRPGAKKLQIAYSPLKREREANFIRGYFRSKAPEYANVPWVRLAGLTRQACAEIMAASAIYAAFPFLESLGLMNLEAMASGCHVVGFTGLGGTEYATPENGDWTEEGGHAAFAAKLRQACRDFESGADDPKIRAGHSTAAQFCEANFEEQLAAAWSDILGRKADLYRL